MLFGALPDGRTVEAFTLANRSGMSVRILTLGGIVQSVLVPDRAGTLRDVALGFLRLAGYLDDPAYHGALIGRYANRIADGQFTLDGRTYTLTRNADGNTLHGGAKGFNAAIWKVEHADDAKVALSHFSPDDDQGFPGNLRIRATYTLSADNALRLAFEANTDAPTILNLCNHTYWNLSGAQTILDHTLQLHADAFTPVDARLLPTGELRKVDGTAFDFRKPRIIRDALRSAHEAQTAPVDGIDNNFVIDRSGGEVLAHAATITAGRTLEVWTSEPGIQVYTGNSLAGGAPGKGGVPYPKWGGIALETQHFPNSPNEPTFPSTTLRTGEVFRSITEFRFGQAGR